MDNKEVAQRLLKMAKSIVADVDDIEDSPIFDVSESVMNDIDGLPLFLQGLIAAYHKKVYKGWDASKVLRRMQKDYDQIGYDVARALVGDGSYWVYPALPAVKKGSLKSKLKRYLAMEAGNVNTEWQWFIKEVKEHRQKFTTLWKQATQIAESRIKGGDNQITADVVQWMKKALR